MLYGQCAEPCRIKQERMRTQSAKQFVIVHNRGQDLAKKKKKRRAQAAEPHQTEAWRPPFAGCVGAQRA